MIMNYLYHRVPKEMRGNILYPLNMLKTEKPEVYKLGVEKYNGREDILSEKIEPLNCLWNDVIHLTAVHPREIKEALSQAGKVLEFDFYEIDPYLLDPSNTTVYLYNKRKGEEKEFEVYDPHNITRYSSLPQRTKDYYIETILNNKDPLLFHIIPHILYKGSIDITAANIIHV
jgi:hypothetical protein